jgi:hypothetical protein
VTCRRHPATSVPTGKGMKPLERGRGGSRTVRGVCDGAYRQLPASAGGGREPEPGTDLPKGGRGNGNTTSQDRKVRRASQPVSDPRQAGTDRPLFEAPRSPIAGGAVWPRGWTIFARSCSEGRTPRARPVERHRGDPAGRKASRHMVSARAQRDREPWKARSGGSAGLGSAVGAKNLERAVECRTGRTKDRTLNVERPEGTVGCTQPQARGYPGKTL